MASGILPGALAKPALAINLSETQLDRIMARQLVLRDWERSGLSGRKFARQRAEVNPGDALDPATLYRWRNKFREVGPHALAGGHHRAGRKVRVEDAPIAFVLAYKAQHRRASLALAHRELLDKRELIGSPKLPSLPTLRRYWHLIDEALRTRLLDGHRRHFERWGVALPRPDGHPNQRWQTDAKMLDIWVIDLETGRQFQPWIVVYLDMASRLVMGAAVCAHEPTREEVLLALKKAIGFAGKHKHWGGIPAEIQSDHGSIFKARDVKAALISLGIVLHHSPRRCPSANGRVERSFRVVDDEFTAAFTDEVRRKRTTGRASGIAELWDALPGQLDDFLINYNVRRIHGVLGTTPYCAWKNGLTDLSSLEVVPGRLRDAIRVTQPLPVGRGGVEIIPGRHYWSKELVPHVGKKIIVSYPPEGPEDDVLAFRHVRDMRAGAPLGRLACLEADPQLANAIKEAANGEHASNLKTFNTLCKKAFTKAGNPYPTSKPKSPSKSKKGRSVEAPPPPPSGAPPPAPTPEEFFAGGYPERKEVQE